MKMLVIFAGLSLCAVSALAAPPSLSLPSSSPSEARLSLCLVSLIDEAQVPAKESGVLMSLPVGEGSRVTVGTMLAQIDDALPQVQRRIAQFQFQQAQEEATNDVEVRHAQAAERVAEAEYQEGIEANAKVAGTISASEIRRRMFTQQRATLQIEQAQFQRKLAAMTAQGKAAEMEGAEKQIERRRIQAPIDGEITQIHRHVGEWVNPGDPVLHLIRMDRLRVEGFVKASEFAPQEIGNRPVTIEVKLARGRVEKFTSQISYVSPVIEASGEYRIWAEVENRTEAGNWLLRPGNTTEMIIHLR